MTPTVRYKSHGTDISTDVSAASSEIYDLPRSSYGAQTRSTKGATVRGILGVGSGGSSSKNKKDITNNEAPQRIVTPPPPRPRSRRQGQYLHLSQKNKCLPVSSDKGLVDDASRHPHLPNSYSEYQFSHGADEQVKSPAKNESPRQLLVTTRRDSKVQTNHRRDSKQRTPAPRRSRSCSDLRCPVRVTTWSADDDSDADLSILPRHDLVNTVLQVIDRVNRQRRPSFDGLKSVLAKGNNEQRVGSSLVAKGVDILSSSVRSLSSSRQRPSRVPKNRSKSVPKGSSSARGESFNDISEPITTLNRTNSNSGRTATLSREILPANGKFDPKTGRCKKHPSVILAQKSKFRKGCWEMIKTECPLCCEECKRKEHKSRWKDDTILKATLSSSPPKNITLRNSLVNDTTDCSSNDAELLHKHSSSPLDHHLNHLKDLVATADSDDTSPIRVSRMPYTTSWGESGWYTGEVNSDGRPQGRGRLRTKTGNVIGGMWSNGYSDDNNLERRKGKMQSGFDTKRDGNVGLEESRPSVSDGVSSRSYRRTGSGGNARSIATSPAPMMGMFPNQGFSQMPPMVFTGQNMEHMMHYYYPQPRMLPMAGYEQNLGQNQTTHGQGVVPTMITPKVNDSK